MSIFSYFTPIATALSPNAEQDDVFAALNLLFPWSWDKWQEGSEVAELEETFKKHFDAKSAVSFSSARVGFYGILKSIADVYGIKPEDSEVLIQAYTTIAIPNQIKWAGFKPVYVDIKENTFNMDPDKIEEKITLRTKILLVQHTFGIPAEMDKIVQIAKSHNLLLVEDCAHSLGAEYKSKKIGTFGEASFFSFGRDKIISSVSGGMVVINNEKLTGKIEEFRNSLSLPPKKWIFQQLAHPIVFALALPVYYFLDIGKLKIVLDQKLGLITKAYSAKEKEGLRAGVIGYRLPNALAILVLGQFKKLERFNHHRRVLARFYEKNFQSDAIKKPAIAAEMLSTPLYYTIQVPNRDGALKFFASMHVVLGDWFPGALGPRGIKEENFDYKKGECPIAEKIGLVSLDLPTNIKTSPEDAKKIIDLMKKFLEVRWEKSA